MIEIVVRIFAVLLLVGAGLHAWGSLSAFEPRTSARAWSLGSASFAGFLAVLAWLLAGRGDQPLNWLLAGGCVAWVLTVGAFGRAIGNLADPRVVYHLAVAAGLAVAALAG
jgi:hypothetical protein